MFRQPWWPLILGVLASSVMAQEPREPGGDAESLVAATRAAIEELESLDAEARADLDAFQQNESDLIEALLEVRKSLPEKPITLDRLDRADREFIGEQLRKAEEFGKAWEYRRSRRQAALESARTLDALGDTLRETHERFFDRVVALRPALIEAQRRIDRREVTVESFGLDPGDRPIAEWLTRTTEIRAQREQLLEEIGEILERVHGRREEFEALAPADPDLSRKVGRIQIALSTIAEATAIGDEQRRRLAEARPEMIAGLLNESASEWKTRRAALESAAAKARTQEDALQSVVSQREALAAPRRDDVSGGDGLPEIQLARQDTELAARVISYYEEDRELLEKMQAEYRALDELTGPCSQLHAAFTREVARLLVTLKHARDLADRGELPEWSPPADVSKQKIWDSWRMAQVAEFERLERAEDFRVALGDATALEEASANIEKARENHRRAEARLETEVSNAEFVVRMTDLDDDELLQLLAAEGEIARALGEIETELAQLEETSAEATERCLAAARRVQTVESPYASDFLKQHAEHLSSLEATINGLEEGDVVPDESESPSLVVTRPTANETFRDTTDKTLTELADAESRVLAREQQFTRVFLDYCESLESGLAQLREGLGERRRWDQELDEQLQARIREEKRRYAAALEVRSRVQAGRLASTRAPADLTRWTTSEGIRDAVEALRRARRESEEFHERGEFDVERLDLLTRGLQWTRVRSETANARVRLIGRPVALLRSALTPLAELDEVDRKNLEYDARNAESKVLTLSERFLERFTSATDRERFEEPLRTYFLEQVNTQRVRQDLEAATQSYEQMCEVCATEKAELQSTRSQLRESLDQRLLDYQAARYVAAIARAPGQRAQIEEVFRKELDRGLPYPLDFQEGNVAHAAEALFGALARLVAERDITEHVEGRLSKVGLDQEVVWYRSQMARIDSLLEVQKSREEDLAQRIAQLRTTYGKLLRTNALRGIGIVLLIPVLAFLMVYLLKLFAKRFEQRVVDRENEESSDRQRRLQTISRTTTAAISVLVWTIALVYVFAQLGLDITPIVASASVLGLAVAFGAQALVKDFFYGFFILTENQFTIGDVVTLGAVTGTVENMSLRITVLRDLKGVAHYIPNGSIGQVSNLTQGWSRVVMEISVAYREDPDHAARILGDVLLEMARDDAWRQAIIEDPVVAGVENFTDSSVDIRVMIKTRPGKQWDVAREARRRIKKRFDELGIEIPFPQRVVHHVYEGDGKAVETGEATRSGAASVSDSSNA